MNPFLGNDGPTPGSQIAGAHRELYSSVEELSRIGNVYFGVTSRIPTDPFDNFCVLLQTRRKFHHVTALTRVQACLGPSGPSSSPLPCATMGRYFSRLSADIRPNISRA